MTSTDKNRERPKTIKQLEEENERKYRLRELNKIMPGWIAEHRFHPQRQWRADFAHPLYKIAVEIEGGVWTNGRHTRAKGYIEDMKKYNAATVDGWQVLRFLPDQHIELAETVRDALLQNCEETF